MRRSKQVRETAVRMVLHGWVDHRDSLKTEDSVSVQVTPSYFGLPLRRGAEPGSLIDFRRRLS
ncbi:hypothetical protein ACFOUO_08600 [Salinithrix halophila]|uniref:Uncharacterized protein n=1 Tax=Salinithrix halophila TaxID=1485204 RepID=A0ABV8JHR2_9BACL